MTTNPTTTDRRTHTTCDELESSNGKPVAMYTKCARACSTLTRIWFNTDVANQSWWSFPTICSDANYLHNRDGSEGENPEAACILKTMFRIQLGNKRTTCFARIRNNFSEAYCYFRNTCYISQFTWKIRRRAVSTMAVFTLKMSSIKTKFDQPAQQVRTFDDTQHITNLFHVYPSSGCPYVVVSMSLTVYRLQYVSPNICCECQTHFVCVDVQSLDTHTIQHRHDSLRSTNESNVCIIPCARNDPNGSGATFPNGADRAATGCRLITIKYTYTHTGTTPQRHNRYGIYIGVIIHVHFHMNHIQYVKSSRRVMRYDKITYCFSLWLFGDPCRRRRQRRRRRRRHWRQPCRDGFGCVCIYDIVCQTI